MTGIAASLGPLKAIKGGRTAERLDVQTPKLPDTRTAERAAVQTSRLPSVQTADRAGVQKIAKRDDPERTKRTVYIRDVTHRAAMRKYEDAGGKEFSDLVERLLQQYNAGRLDG